METGKITKKDYIIMCILTIFYLLISFYNLGTMNTPKTYYKFNNQGDSIEIELENGSQYISKMRYYTGPEVGNITLMGSIDGNTYEQIAELKGNYTFSWEDLELYTAVKYIKFISQTSGVYLGEIQLYNGADEKIAVKTNDEDSKLILDELKTVPDEISCINSSYFDEVYFGRSAYEYVNGIPAMEWTHPPLGKLIMALPVLLFGMSTFSYRLMGNIAGAIMIPVIYVFAKRMFKQTKWATLAGIIMTFDCFHFAQTRMGTADSFLVLFIILSSLFMYQYISSDENTKLKSKLKNLFLCGLFFGCSISVKWTGFYAGLALAIIFFVDLIYKRFKKKQINNKEVIKIILACCLFFILIPATIYILCYLLFPTLVNYKDNSISGIIDITNDMYIYHSTLEATHPFSSNWYTWPIMLKPVWYYVGYHGENLKSTIVGIGNPTVWWFGILATIFTLIKGIAKRRKEELFIIAFIACIWLPYIFIGRVMFMYHFFPALPFVMLAIVSFVKWITEKTKNNIFYWIYIIAVIVLFFVFYPVISGMITSSEYIDSLKWLSTWIF